MIKVIDLNSGNISSIENWLNRNQLKYSIINFDSEWKKDDIILLPGVGNSVSFTNKLKTWIKLCSAIKKKEVNKIVAICGGYHSFCTSITEGAEQTLGLNIIDAKCIPLPNGKSNTGWSMVKLNNLKDFNSKYRQEVFFNHGCAVIPNKKDIKFVIDAKSKFAVGYFDNYLNLMQFHPEKSGVYGDQLAKEIFNV